MAGKNSGRQGNKPLKGTNGEDTLFVGKDIPGFDGTDQINGGGGNDHIFAGSGIDYINAGGGDDVIYGDALVTDSEWMENPLEGDPGSQYTFDEEVGEAGNDIIHAGGGDDTVFAGGGDDEIKGQGGSDYLDGGDGYDTAAGYGSLLDYQINGDSYDPGLTDDPSVHVTLTETSGDMDTLVNIERVQFSDYTLYLDGTNNEAYAVDDSATVSEDGPAIDISVLANDLEFDGEPLYVTGVLTPPGSGVATDNGDGTINFNPNGDFEYLAVGETAEVSFTYGVNDSDPGAPYQSVGTVTVTVTGVNDEVTALFEGDDGDPDPATANVDENDAGAIIGALTAVDADASDTHSWSLSGTDADLFEIDGSGNLKLKDDVSADFETKDVLYVTATADDGHGSTDDVAIEVSVNDLEEVQLTVEYDAWV